ncbi:RNA methyltransferase [Sphingorhabdus lutea]|uniref:RNA methyltransferase n=1 Tax=Sphingorhabdus lutea TaxID=1913578 RepID=A0A1L3JCK6_9SPHN|nr:RNA methyltransferase [Sphingorhabdus lutea]APG62829.1 RNA methyltransferase [Sphingorhabdus lutea]
MHDEPHIITGFSNPIVRHAKSLRIKKFRKQEGMFLAEGLRIIIEAMDADKYPLRMFVDQAELSHPILQDVIKRAGAHNCEIIETNANIMSKISGKDNSQKAIAIFADHLTKLQDLDRDSAKIWLVAQSLRDPGNLGTMLRTGDAVGAGGLILLDDCTDPFSAEAIRASMGAAFTQHIVTSNAEAFFTWLRHGNGQLVGTSLNTDQDYQAVSYQGPCFILTGNESQGLPIAYEQKCDLLVKMPMRGKADSLNAAVATAVMAYEVLNQFRRVED